MSSVAAFERAVRIAGLGIVLLVLNGCAPTSVVEGGFPTVSYTSLAKREPPLRWNLVVEFQRDGQPDTTRDARLRSIVERVLLDSQVAEVAYSAYQGTLRVVLNSHPEGTVSQIAKGSLSGATLGLIGNVVSDEFEMDITLEAGGKQLRCSGLHQTLRTRFGNASLPDTGPIFSPMAAEDYAVKQLVIEALRRLEESQDFPRF